MASVVRVTATNETGLVQACREAICAPPAKTTPLNSMASAVLSPAALAMMPKAMPYMAMLGTSTMPRTAPDLKPTQVKGGAAIGFMWDGVPLRFAEEIGITSKHTFDG